MPFVAQIEPDQATGLLKQIYDASKQRMGHVAEIIKLMSQDPVSCQGSMGLYGALMKTENELSVEQKEMLATVVSNANDCFY